MTMIELLDYRVEVLHVFDLTASESQIIIYGPKLLQKGDQIPLFKVKESLMSCCVKIGFKASEVYFDLVVRRDSICKEI
jgi:hypothetical protein